LPTTFTVYLPKYAPSRDCYEWGPYKEPLIPGKFNIPEPFTVTQPQPHIHVALVPALGIDKNGTRLGWGHGFYDRLLSIHTPVRIGVIFSDQEWDTLPIDNWDIPITHIVTEHGLRKILVPPH
ncbi:MAG: 5-formyltetrahydrofolate cyclo-ligase, partial [Candidatus Marinamargulisbacteria bacterium]